jgi:DNA-binding CsgD family transcriptional regulator/tetratricopeptide (TPR) repeat protein
LIAEVCDDRGVTARVSSASMVGRAVESARLDAVLGRVAAGTFAVVVVAGEAGVGKTRLVNELIGRANVAGTVALTGGCLDVGDGVLPYAPVVEALRRLAHWLDEADLDRVLGDARSYLARLVPELGSLRGPAWEASGVDPQAPGRLFELFLGVLHRLAERSPVLLVIEDLQWADRSTRELIAYLARNHPAGVVLVVTYRSDDVRRGHPLRAFLAELERSRAVERIDLARLGRRDLVQLVAGIRGRPAPAALVSDVMARSDGNPFFAEELLAAHGQGVDTSSVLRELVLTRVHALSESVQSLLETAAVAGRRVDHELLAEVAGLPPQRLLELLREAVDRHVLVVEPVVALAVGRDAAGEMYAFRHALVQEAIYDCLLAAQRGPLHAAYADTMTRRLDQRYGAGDPGADAAVELGQLAYHWQAANDLERALPAYVRAGVAAGAAAALTESLRFYERAAQLWQQVPRAAEHSPLDLTAMLERAAEVAYLVGDHDRAVTLAKQALAQIGSADRSRAGVLLARLAQYHWAAADGDQAIATIEDAVAAISPRPPSRELAIVLTAQARLLLIRGGHEQACRISERAVAVAHEARAAAEEVQALITLGSSYCELGKAELGITHLERGRCLADEIGDAAGLCRAYSNLSVELRELGRPTEAVTVAIEGSELASRFGLMRSHGVHMLVTAAETLVWLGRWDEAEPLLDEVFALDPPIFDEVEGRVARAFLRLWRGDFHGSRADLTVITERATSRLARQYASWALGTLADLASWEGQPVEARAAVSRGLALELGSPKLWSPEPYISDRDVVVELCRAGLSAEAAIAEQARARRATAELETAVEHAATLLAQAHAAISDLPGPPAPYLTAALATADAEWTRTAGQNNPARWADAAHAWDALAYPHPAAYARWRQAEALLASAAPRDQVTATITTAWQQANDLGARPLAAQIESLARRARVKLDASPSQPDASDVGDKLGLTNREREVLALVADGRTNRQIAETLFISNKTASVHVSNILAKLDVANRGQAGALAHRLGLIA